MPYKFRQRYLLVRQVGRGAMGAVFHAIDEQAPTHAQDVAIKVAKLKGGAQGDPERAKTGFEREIRAAIMLSEHKNYFVGYRTSDQVDPAFIAFEYVSWPTLAKYVEEEGLAPAKKMHARKRLPPLHVARLGVEILRGIRCMERRRMVHRDLKPDNIFVRRRESTELFDAKIADLGVWIDSGEPGTIVDAPEAFKLAGTIAYMSPEQMRGEHLTSASDLHMLASVRIRCTDPVLFSAE